MTIKSSLFIYAALLCSRIFAVESDDLMRKGKFLGITGYISGSTDFHVVPFWKQWNALLQVNIEKNKHKHNGIYVVPASPLYYPTYDGYGFYVPHNIGGFGHGNNFQSGLPLKPMPLLLDEYKPMVTTLAPSDSPDLDDKPKLITNELNLPSKKTDKNVSVLNLNVQDDRKTHKRDIEHKNRTEDEVVATVVEVTATESSETATTSEPSVDPTTELPTTNSPETLETTTKPIPTTETATSPSSTTEVPYASIVDWGFHPSLDFYYGGTPNENANSIYLTTSQPDLSPPPSQTEIPNASSNDRSDSNIFKPSIQYEYRNYRYDTDNHFIPIVGTKQIF